MIASPNRRGQPGFVSYLLVLSTGAILTALTVLTYRRAVEGQEVQKNVQLRMDYGEKEDAVLRSIVAITPNRAIRAMQHNSNSSTSISRPLRWRNIFTEALVLADARSSISAELLASLAIPNLKLGNSGDSSLDTPSALFKAIGTETGYVSAGINRSLGGVYPVPLSSANTTTTSRDGVYPIISADKVYGTLAQGGVALPVETYSKFNLLPYPQINFGYATPGELFVAKRNWWAFSLDIAAQDQATTQLSRPGRDLVLSIYEVPSQLAISASSFLSLGQYASGAAWQNVTISGGVFAGKALIEGTTALPALASRRSMTLSGDTTIGGQNFLGSPFTPGVREAYQVTQGEFFPASLASESGRVAFVPLNRGADYFDRLAHLGESEVLSPTTWNNYTVGALQCAMRLDITQAVSSTNKKPTALRFSFLRGGARQDLNISLTTPLGAALPLGYLYACNENQTYDFGTAVVDLAYGKNNHFYYQTGITGVVTFNNARFGDPLVGTFKSGYFKPSYPFELEEMNIGGATKYCMAIYPQRFPKFLAAINAAATAVNSSLVVNVDYTTATGSVNLTRPSIPCAESDYGLILRECADLREFSNGFSLVTNLRTYIGDDFNIVATTPPAGYAPDGPYYPPCSLFTPERRYGVEVDPFAVTVGGQLGSLASETNTDPVRPLDSKNMSGNLMGADRITMNLRPIRHPAEVPPISMMNWLVVLEERAKAFVGVGY